MNVCSIRRATQYTSIFFFSCQHTLPKNGCSLPKGNEKEGIVDKLSYGTRYLFKAI